jgi:DNA mismatch repair protein MutL
VSHFPEAGTYETMQVREELTPYPAPSSPAADVDMIPAPAWRMAGQLKGTYLVMEGNEGVMIVDHHAAHERILYERMKRSLHGEQVSRQPFLIPQPIEVKQEEKELLIGHRAALAKVGLELVDFGERAVAVTSVPSFLQGEELQPLLDALSEELAERGEGDTVDQILDRICAFLACRGAIKANRRLQEEEARSLLKGWEDAGRPATCPHGRPLFVQWSWGEIEGWFKRG